MAGIRNLPRRSSFSWGAGQKAIDSCQEGVVCTASHIRSPHCMCASQRRLQRASPGGLVYGCNAALNDQSRHLLLPNVNVTLCWVFQEALLCNLHRTCHVLLTSMVFLIKTVGSESELPVDSTLSMRRSPCQHGHTVTGRCWSRARSESKLQQSQQLCAPQAQGCPSPLLTPSKPAGWRWCLLRTRLVQERC